MAKGLSLYEKWKKDSEYENPVGFSGQKMNKTSNEKILGMIDKLDELEDKINNNKVSKKEIKKIKKNVDEMIEELNVLNENEIENKLDEGLPSESGKYNGMNYEEILSRALQMENDAVEINLMLLEIAPDEDRKKFVEIANDENDHSLDRVYHQTVKKVTDDFEKLGFNTAISQMMIFINECYKAEHVYKEYAENFIKMLSCIAPHICEEMWQQLGHNDSIAYEPWPTYDEKMLVSDTVQMGIQVNGKLRAKIEVAKDADDEAVKELAFQQENVKAHTDGKNIVKVIVVKNKIVNIVVK